MHDMSNCMMEISSNLVKGAEFERNIDILSTLKVNKYLIMHANN